MDELNLETQIENIKAKASMNKIANVSYPKAPAPKVNLTIDNPLSYIEQTKKITATLLCELGNLKQSNN